jgi:PAS domain S-box-containing protein
MPENSPDDCPGHLEGAEAEIRFTLDMIPTLAWSAEEDGFAFVNRRWCQYTGLSSEQAQGWGWKAAFHPEDLEQVLSRWEEIRQSKAPAEVDVRLRRHDGVYRLFVSRTTPYLDKEGNVLKWFGIMTDIEDLKHAEHLARGQLDTLTRTLSSLAQESGPDKFLEHVLTTITGQLGAYSIGMYDLDASTRVRPVAHCDDGVLRLITADEAAAYPQVLLPSETHPVWTDFCRTGKRCVLVDIRGNPIRVRFAEDANSPWHEWVWEESGRWPTLKRQYAEGCVEILIVPIIVSGKCSGCLTIRFKERRSLRPEEFALTRALAHQATLALQLLRLSRQSREAAVDAERHRMARDMHDTLAQGFTGVILQLEAARGALDRRDLAGATECIGQAGDLARVGLGDARRAVLALRSQSLEDTSLRSALEDLVKRMTSGTALLGEVHLSGEEPPLPAEWKEGLLRVTQESLTNTIRHASAKMFRAKIAFLPPRTELDLVDDGSGFDPNAEHEGFGLLGMRERIGELGGQIRVDSSPGRGTQIRIVLENPREAHVNGGPRHA